MKSLFYQELLLREQGLLPRPQSKLQRRQGQEGWKGEGRIKGRTKEDMEVCSAAKDLKMSKSVD